VHIVTKFGLTWSNEEFGVKGDPAYVRATYEASLKRLDIDYIDLYYQHRVDIIVPIEATVSLQIPNP
jgi:aryl-alcohol dehydrogenase-like predicted oxidoreductase